MLFGAAILRRIPFQEVAAGIQRAGACPCAAAVEAVVVGEGMALAACVMVLVCNDSLQNQNQKGKMVRRYAS